MSTDQDGGSMSNAQVWDERYGEAEQLFSGNPNGVLVAEVTGLQPGQALDVGCGEGGDARWLADQGWHVTAIDVSKVALERAARTVGEPANVSWTRADLTITVPPAGAFDLVSMHYFPLPHQSSHSALRGLLAAVAPGGTLLIASHDLTGLSPDHFHGVDPADYYQPAEIAEHLDEAWDVLVNETRARTNPVPEGPGSAHINDIVLRAQRRR